jgi:hypothetical protein
MDLVEQLGQALDLVDDDRLRRVERLLGDPSGVPAQGQEDAAVQQVVDARTAEHAAHERGLPGLARAQQEVGLALQRSREIQRPGHEGGGVRGGHCRLHRQIS